MVNEPYQEKIEFTKGGVRIVVYADAENDTDEARAEAEKRAKAIVEHFQFLMGTM